MEEGERNMKIKSDVTVNLTMTLDQHDAEVLSAFLSAHSANTVRELMGEGPDAERAASLVAQLYEALSESIGGQ
jgi:hypothetical protein